MIFMMQFFSRSFAAAVFALALIVAGDARAQGAMSGVPNAMQGFSQNRDQPIQIEAASLEMRDKKKEATFAGNVKVVQGDTTMTSKSLVVFYDSGRRRRPRRRPPRRRDRNPGRCSPRRPGPGGSSSIRRLEAKGSVVVTQKDQVVTGETAIFDTRANLITMVGGVVLTQCKNVLARRPPQGRHDHRRVAGRIRQRQGAGHVHPGTGLRVGVGRSQAGAGRSPSLIPGKK